jgi:hypothetical protein
VLSYEWASLPAGVGLPGRYGQPQKSAEWLAAVYAQAGGGFNASNTALAQAVGGAIVA